MFGAKAARRYFDNEENIWTEVFIISSITEG